MTAEEIDDPFADLEKEAKRQEWEEKAAAAFSWARGKLVLGKTPSHVFFANLALRMEPKVDWACETAWVDGKFFGYNPEWFASLSPKEQAQAVECHEVMHLADKHHARMGNRNPKKWNEAADLAINPLLRDCGLQLPSYGLFPGEGPPRYKNLPTGLSAEGYYDLLPDEDEQGKGDEPGGEPGDGEGDGDGSGQGEDPGKMGGVRKPGDGSEAAARQSESEWGENVAAAAHAAKQKGDLPGALARLVDHLLAPKVDWRHVLREFVSQIVKEGFDWLRPNRRYVGYKLHLPSRRSETVGNVLCDVDTSGSIGDAVLTRFASEIQGIMEAYPGAELTIMYSDAKVQHIQHWNPQDGPLVLEPKGGGGTSHVPVFEWIDEQDEQPACVICLTDCYTDYPAKAPDYPVLWAVVGNKSAKPPFGQVVHVED